MIDNGEFLEYTRYVNNYYGTPLAPIYDHINNGYDVFLDIEVEGHGNVKKKIQRRQKLF